MATRAVSPKLTVLSKVTRAGANRAPSANTGAAATCQRSASVGTSVRWVAANVVPCGAAVGVPPGAVTVMAAAVVPGSPVTVSASSEGAGR